MACCAWSNLYVSVIDGEINDLLNVTMIISESSWRARDWIR